MKKIIYLFALLVLISASCKKKQTENADSHSAEVKLQLTAYSNEFELFAEADPFVAGKPSGILSHFSHLPSFKALEKGSVTIRLIVDNKEVTQTLDKPTRKGIYKFEIKPETKGVGRLVYDFKIDNSQFQLEVPNITVYGDEKEAVEAATQAAVSRTNTVSFTKEQSWKIEFASGLPAEEPFGQVIKTSAQVVSAPDDEMVISAKTSGMVVFTGNAMTSGKNITPGQTLFTISGGNMADNNLSVRIQEAQNNYDRTQKDYERKKELAIEKIVSEKDLQIAKNDFYNAKALYDMLSKNFSTGSQTVTSPMGGFIKHLYVTNGQFVEAGQSVISVTKNKTLMLKADVQQKYAPILGSVVSANIRTVQDNRTYSLEELNGKILSYGRNTNEGNYLIPVSLQIENRGNFISGGFVDLFLKTLTSTRALTVPNTALLEEQGNYFVFMQVHPELFEKKEVKPGATDGLKTEIVSGITKDDWIITTGAIFVKLAQATGTLDPHSGHTH
ncbi:MAG: efflux RND transporter periplasmic adaptor subunit [Bacteroidales bacterium]